LKVLTKTQQTHGPNTTKCDVKHTRTPPFTGERFYADSSKLHAQTHATSVQHGFTLIELMVVICILCVLVVSAISNYESLMQLYDIRRFVSVNQHILNQARTNALLYHTAILVCGSQNGQSCDQHWSSGVLAFIDRNDDKQFSPVADTLLNFEPLVLRYGSVQWKGFGQRSFILYDALTGTPNASNGSLTYCATLPIYHRQLILNRMGRIRESLDTNHDGQYEDASGQPIACG
jgi:type IV fimbrial biogenesis protein FimT